MTKERSRPGGRDGEDHRQVQPKQRIWDTTTAPSADFTDAWEARLAKAAFAHFALRLDWLQWEAKHGRHARAVLADDGGRRALLVLRHEKQGWHCGWPWRTQIAFERGGAEGDMGLDPETAVWAFEQAQRAGAGDRVRVFLPASTLGRGAITRGTTIVKDLALDDDGLLASFGADKRRQIRKLEKTGWEVIEGTTAEHFRAFRQLQFDNDARLGHGTPTPMVDRPAPGEDWREWELPWQWLLLAVHEGVVHAGSGYGRAANGMVDYRANASTPEGRKAGANALVAWAALRLARDGGWTRMNWGGNTTFKKQLGGEPVVMSDRLGGGPLWAAPNAVEVAVGRTRAELAKWVKERRAKPGRKDAKS